MAGTMWLMCVMDHLSRRIMSITGLKTFSVDVGSFGDWCDGGGFENTGYDCLEIGLRRHMEELVLAYRPEGGHQVPWPYGHSPASEPSA